jgi:hypothetical protein
MAFAIINVIMLKYIMKSSKQINELHKFIDILRTTTTSVAPKLHTSKLCEGCTKLHQAASDSNQYYCNEHKCYLRISEYGNAIRLAHCPHPIV